MRKILKTMVVVVHRIIVYFMFIGVLLPNHLLFYYLCVWPGVYLHWQINDQHCILTQLEYYLDGRKFPPKAQDDHNYPFAQGILRTIGIYIHDSQLHGLILFVLTTLWIIGFIRYCLRW